jgi:hypothetical protein
MMQKLIESVWVRRVIIYKHSKYSLKPQLLIIYNLWIGSRLRNRNVNHVTTESGSGL